MKFLYFLMAVAFVGLLYAGYNGISGELHSIVNLTNQLQNHLFDQVNQISSYSLIF